MDRPATSDSLPAECFLGARSRKRALDWSLVLLSQGLESRVEQTEAGWGLWIPASERARADTILAAYQRENRAWFWLRRSESGALRWHPAVLGWAAVLAFLYWAQTHVTGDLARAGGMDNAAVADGEWWRLWLAVGLHADLRHLLGNLTVGSVLLGLAMGRHGCGWSLTGTFAGGVLGNLLGFWCYAAPHRGLGASGMVMAALGLLAAGSPAASWKRPGRWFWVWRSVCAAVLLFMLLGLDQNSDILAHLGGFAGGVLWGIALAWVPARWRQNAFADAALAALPIILTALGWALALRPPA